MPLAKWVIDWLPDKWESDEQIVSLVKKVVGEKKYDRWKKYPLPLNLNIVIPILKMYKRRGDVEGAKASVSIIVSSKHPPDKVRKLMGAFYRIMGDSAGCHQYDNNLLIPADKLVVGIYPTLKTRR